MSTHTHAQISFVVCRLLNIYIIYIDGWNGPSWTNEMSIQTDQLKTTAVLVSFSLVFICRENPRRSGILLFPNCPRFWRLMKTRHLKYLRSSGMEGDKFGESVAFLFSRRARRRVPDLCNGRRSFPTNEFVLSGTSAMNFAHYQSPKLQGSSPLSHINMAYLGQTCGDYLIYRQNLGQSAKSKIPVRLGFSRHMKLCEICYFFHTLLIAVFFKSFLLKLRKKFASKFLQTTSIQDISGESGSSF